MNTSVLGSNRHEKFDDATVFRPSDRAVVMIDGSNFYMSCKTLGFNADYKKIHNYFAARTNLLRPIYYTALVMEADNSCRIKPMIDWLQYHGWTLVTKKARIFENGIKGNMDVEIAIDIIKYAQLVQHIILITGDGDFVPAVASAQRDYGCKVTVVSTISSADANNLSDALRRQADHFMDISNYMEEFRADRKSPMLRGPGDIA